MTNHSQRFWSLLCACLLASAVFATAQIQVNSTNPNAAPQGTTNLNVTVSGSGFKKGANAKWFVSGTTNPGGVTVNSTTFNSSSQLTANITISTTAVTSGFDVVVTNTDGRTGVGRDAFTVTQSFGYSVTSNVLDTLNAVTPVCANPPCETLLHSDSALSGGSNAYSTTKNGSSSIGSSVGNIEWALNLTEQAVRTVYLTFSQPVSGSESQPVPDGYYPALVFSRCFPAYGGAEESWPMTLGTNSICSIRAHFFVGSQEYYLVMSPNGKYRGTGWASVTCNKVDSTGVCNDWTAVPNLSADPNNYPAVAELLSCCTGRLQTQTPIGFYYNTFNIHVTRP
jgi:hypothetical protein